MPNVESQAALKQGTLVGCDAKQEWLLSWWWGHYTAHNSYPVAFADFGMSPQSRAWCKARGRLLPIPKHNHWQHLSSLQKIWFKKPLAMARSPFDRTLWLDLDCEVRGSLDPLFSFPVTTAQMGAMAIEKDQLLMQGKTLEVPHYNSGVVLFEKGSSLLQFWIRAIDERSRVVCTEEDLLSLLVAHFEIPLFPLPQTANWEVLRFGPNPDALIYHWMGDAGKKAIRDSTSKIGNGSEC